MTGPDAEREAFVKRLRNLGFYKAADQVTSGFGLHARAERAETEVARLRDAVTLSNDEICQTLGKALGYPWFCDDQKNFPGATRENGVCVGDHVAASMAQEAAREIARLRAENVGLGEALTNVAAVEKQIRLVAYASAGDPSRINDMRMFAVWAGSLQAALSPKPQAADAGEQK